MVGLKISIMNVTGIYFIVVDNDVIDEVGAYGYLGQLLGETQSTRNRLNEEITVAAVPSGTTSK